MSESNVSVIEVARRAGVRPLAVYLDIWLGKLTATKVNRKWAIPATEAEKFIQARQRLNGKP